MEGFAPGDTVVVNQKGACASALVPLDRQRPPACKIRQKKQGGPCHEFTFHAKILTSLESVHHLLHYPQVARFSALYARWDMVLVKRLLTGKGDMHDSSSGRVRLLLRTLNHSNPLRMLRL